MRPRVPAAVFGFVLVLSLAQTVRATTFVLPTDDELISKADAIVVGTVEGAFVRERGPEIETVSEIRLERAIKGAGRPGELIRVAEPGGMVGDHGVLVVGTPRYEQGDRVLVFLSASDGEWHTTDFTLGKFRFATSTAGERVLVRQTEDVVGWDHSGQVHHEKVRREDGFLRYVEERVRGHKPLADYEVEASQVTLAPAGTTNLSTSSSVTANAAPFPAETYVAWVSNTPPRWPDITAGVTFYKRSDMNLSGAADGGVSTIQSGLAAWTNDCASVINLIYGGQRATASANFDGVNVVEFNDPQGRVSGSWTGSGTVAITFISFGSNHTFNGRSWLSITDADVVFQDGFPASNAALAPAMTHELGHGIGWRHSNQDYATGGTCNSAVEECTSAAIMNSSVSGNYGFTLQPFDVHAAESVYPGGTCGSTCTPPSITAQPRSISITRGTSTTLSVAASGTAPLSYQWYVGASGNTASPVPGGTGPSLAVGPSSTTSYWVRVSNSCGSANSATATVTVNVVAAGRVRGDYNGDGVTDIAVFRPSTGEWLIRGVGTFTWGQNGDKPVPGDYNGDGVTEAAVFRPSNGTWYVRNQFTVTWGQSGDIPVARDFNGDGRDDIAVFRPSTGEWFVRNVASFTWGQNGDQVVPADYNGDGVVDVAVFRPSAGIWYIRLLESPSWGESGDRAVPADYNGDRREDVAVFRPSTGYWYVRSVTTAQWGQSGDEPVPGDYNGDGVTDIAVFRPSNGMWYIRNIASVQWGQSGDIPVSR